MGGGGALRARVQATRPMGPWRPDRRGAGLHAAPKAVSLAEPWRRLTIALVSPTPGDLTSSAKSLQDSWR
ncbi:hypothetical protein STBA_15940 [Streptomyces sp. MP131-18]|nr:hypothetical protein STBA_15940 [Streptomyces sp. MP131-18]